MAELDPRWPDWRDFLTAARQDCKAQLQQTAAGRSLCRLALPARKLTPLKQLEGRYTSYRTLARETLAGEVPGARLARLSPRRPQCSPSDGSLAAARLKQTKG